MKRLFNWLLVVCMLLALLPTAALAAEGAPADAGMYEITGSLTLTPQTEAGTEITASTQGGHTDYYANAVRFGVSGTVLTAGVQYLLLVIQGAKGTLPTESSIVYMDQAAAGADGTITFNAYPNRFAGGHYCVYLVSTGKSFNAASPAAEFDYHQPYTLGDCDGVEGIDVRDVAAVLNHIVGNHLLEGNLYMAADVTKDTHVDINDVAMLLNYVVKNITSLG